MVDGYDKYAFRPQRGRIIFGLCLMKMFGFWLTEKLYSVKQKIKSSSIVFQSILFSLIQMLYF